MMRGRMMLVAVGLGLLVGCADRGPEIPDTARDQVPQGAPDRRWFGEGRLELKAPGKRLSCTALVRGLGHGRARMALVTDEGVQLADLTAGPDGCTVNQKLEVMDRALPILEFLLRQAWTAHGDDHPQANDHRLQVIDAEDTRWYGGDPVLLRAVEGPGMDLVISDWRPFGEKLLPYAAVAHTGFGLVTVTVHLNRVRALGG
jgi:hypothetical protein